MAAPVENADSTEGASPIPTPKLNVDSVVFGDLLIKSWYPSFYPREIVGSHVEMLYVCHTCFRYTSEALTYATHTRLCQLKEGPPPGILLYEKDQLSIYEVDGGEHKNLSLFAKLFLDTKSVFYDVSTFDYYIMATTSSSGEKQIIGFFSKEKMSWDNNNVACILVFPPWQRQGLGQVLIAISYGLSRIEGRQGGPEKPLSALGKKGYGQYWCAAVCRCVLKAKAKRITVQQIVEETFMLPEDVIAALGILGAVDDKAKANGSFGLDTACLKAWANEHRSLMQEAVSADAFIVGNRTNL